MKQKIRFLYLTDSLLMGGDTRCEIWLLSQIDKQAFDLVAITSGEGQPCEMVRSIPDISHYPLNFGTQISGKDSKNVFRRYLEQAKAAGRLVAALARVAKIGRKHRPEAIFVGDRTRSMLAGLVAKLVTGAPLVFHPQFFYHESFANAPLKRFIARRAELVVANSHYTGNTYLAIGVKESRMLVAHNGIDADRFTPGDGSLARNQYGIGPEAPLVGIFGNLRPFKGHASLIQAMAIVQQDIPDAHLLVVGDGPLEDELRDLAAKLGLEKRVIFTGFQQNTTPLFRAIDLFVMASTEEPFGLVTIEAMACEKPVVGTNSGGTPEIVSQGETGLLVPHENPPELARAIVQLLKDRDRRSAMGLKGRSRVLELFTLSSRSQKISQALKSLCAGQKEII